MIHDNRSTVATDGNGRDAHGRFAAGNGFARGNPIHRRVARLRAEVLRAVSPSDVSAIVRALLERATAGDVTAARELLDRALGKSTTAQEVGTMPLPPMHNAADIVTALGMIVRALSDGAIGAEQAMRAAAIVDLSRRAIETHELDQRIAALEADIATGKWT